MSVPDIEAMIREVRRELGQRRHAYPRFIAAGKLTQTEADKGMAALEGVLARLEAHRVAERPELAL